jgi:holo-[acyl-carrier protein] synthase
MKKNTPNALPTVQGVGTDIIEIERIKEAIARHGDRFLDRLFTAKEKTYCLRYKDSIPRFAGRFAAKEAVLKAFGTGITQEMTWKEIEILNDKQGKPEVQLSARLRDVLSVDHIFLSISHCDAYATATAIVVA